MSDIIERPNGKLILIDGPLLPIDEIVNKLSKLKEKVSADHKHEDITEEALIMNYRSDTGYSVCNEYAKQRAEKMKKLGMEYNPNTG